MKKFLLPLVSVLLVVASPNVGFGQVTIAVQDFETSPATPTVTHDGAGGEVTGNGNTPNDPKYVSGSRGWEHSNGTSTLTFATVDASSYTDVFVTFRLASFSGTSGNGADGSDEVYLDISDDSGSTWSREVEVQGNSNARWSFDTGTGVVNVAYDGNNAPDINTPGGGGNRTTDGYSTVTLTGLPEVSGLRVRLVLNNNSSNEDWVVDDMEIKGTLASSDTEVNFTSATSTETEDGTSIQVCAGIVNESATPTTVSLNLTGGSATNGTDFFSNAGLSVNFPATQTLTFPASSSSDQCATVYIEDDSDIESDETITFSLSGASGGTNASVGSTNTHTLTITDNDGPSSCLSEGFEGGSPAGWSNNSAYFNTGSANTGTGKAGMNGTGDWIRTDAISNPYELTFYARASGSTSNFTIEVEHATSTSGPWTSAGSFNANGSNSGDITNAYQQFTVSLSLSGTRYLRWRVSARTGGSYYLDDVEVTCLVPTIPAVNLSVSASSGTEAGATAITVTATADFAVTGDQTVDLAVTGTGITAGDYTLSATSITILDGQTTGTVTFTVVDDAVTETTETATLTISNPSGGATIGSTATQDIDITDNDQPVLTATPTSLTGFSTTSGTASSTQQYTLTGTNLVPASGALTLTAPAGFELSINGGANWLTPLSLVYNGGSTNTDILVRIADNAAVGSPSGNITNAGGGATTVDVALSGTVNALPCTTPNDVATLVLTPTSSTVGGVITPPAGGASGYVVVRHTTTTLGGTPSNASTYSAGNSIGSGTVVYSGTGTSFTDAGPLVASTEYFYFVFAYNNTNCSGGPVYSGEFEESVTTLSGPCLSENFDASTGVPAGWSQSGTSNSNFSGHGSSTPNARGIGSGDELISPTVDYPSSISFNVDASGGGDGETLTLEYRVGAGAWTIVGTATASTAGATETFALNSAPHNLTSSADVSFRLTASSNTIYVDDIEVFCASAQPSIELSLVAPLSGTGTEADETTVTLRATASETLTANHSVEVDISTNSPAVITAGDFDVTQVDFENTVTINIASGSSFGELTFDIEDDAIAEGPETATFTISNPSSGVVIGTNSTVDLDITDNDNLNSTESVIVEQGGEATGISSVINGTITNNTEGTQVWAFNLYDGDGTDDADNHPTIYEQFTIRQSGGNTVPNWDDAIDNVKFFLGASATPIAGSFLVSPSTISFTPTSPISVADGTTPAEIFMRLTLDASLPAGSDGQHFGFSLDDADVTVESDVLLSSQLGTFANQTSDAGLNGIDITATLQFIDAPTAVTLGSNFSVTVSAVDANGNVDTGVSNSITLSHTSGTGTLSGAPATVNLSSGTYTFSGLSHDTEETIEITVVDNASTFADLTANINVTDEPHQLFDDFNRSDNAVIGIPSSGGSTSWTEDEFGGDGTKIRIVNGELRLNNCILSDPLGSSGGTGMQKIVFNVENHYETLLDNASGMAEWLVNVTQSRSNPSGFGNTGTYAAAFVLGSDVSDYESASADGYAVIIGKSGSSDPVQLVAFTGGLTGTHTEIASSNDDSPDDYHSVKVTYDPCTGEWNLYARNDGSSFDAPNVGSLGTPFTGTDQTHTDLDLKYFGAAWRHGSSCTESARFDNMNIPTVTTASTTAKLWNGSVNADWNEANNWGPCPGVPTNTDDVVIPNVATQPIISGAPTAFSKDLTINSGADLTINSGQYLNTWGDVVNNGSADFGQGTFTMEGNPSTLSLTGNVNVANFHVSTDVTLNGTVTVSDVARSEINGAITSNGNLVLEDGAQLFHGTGTTFGGGTVSGNIVVRRQGNGSGGFNGWSTPVVGGSLPGSNGYSYNSTLGTNSNADDNNPDPDPGWVAHSGTMAAGKGYFSVDGNLATFTGVANDGSITPSVTTSSEALASTTAPTFFNLIGNPYPSAIDADQFISDNSSRIDGALYFWSDENAGVAAYSSDDYATYSTGGSVVPLTAGANSGVPNGSIPSCQGFFVNCDASGTINFNNGQRGGNNSQFFRMAAPNSQRMWLSINNDNLELFNQTLVGFDEFATDQKDWGVDAYKLRGNQAISIGSIQDGETYVIATYESIPQSGKVVPLMTYVETAGTYTFVADSMEGFTGYDVFLQDLSDGALYPLEQGDSYSFAMTSDDEFGRFQLWYSPAVVTGIDESNVAGRIFTDLNSVTVNWNQSINTFGTLELIDMTGRIVLSESMIISNGNGSKQLPQVANGVYSVRFSSDDKQFVISKKFVFSK